MLFVPCPQDFPAARAPEEERAAFELAPGFVAELVAAEPEIAKVVDLAFDDAGRMWALTAREYPLDGNESPAAAELYRRGGRDQVLVFDQPWSAGRQTPRVFAEGLAMPLALLPLRGGLLLGHGPEILFLRDTDGDGRADQREVVLAGFGIQDSHLMPHRFVRGPGDWIFTAQGAFNSSLVVTRDGTRVPFEQCKLARFQPDGSRFEVIGHGLNNIWGFVLDRAGETFLQEANDLGYPLAPFYFHASYPGIGDHRHRPYSPWQPAPIDFAMGGTGLSGLALSQDRDGFPAPWRDAFFLANPIVNALQTIEFPRDGRKPVRREDLLRSRDPWFRPVALHFGPDGCLYVVDWYNEIISHNEVPRADPRRDKARGRIWRIRHESMVPRVPVDVSRLADARLVARLSADSTWEARAAWHQIVERGARTLVPSLRALAADPQALLDARILALWSLEGLAAADPVTLASLARSAAPWEAARALADGALVDQGAEWRALLALLSGVPDARTRLATIRALAAGAARDFGFSAGTLLAMASEPSAAQGPFERSLVRAALEEHPRELEAFLDSPASTSLPLAARELAVLALPGEAGARRLARLLPELGRTPTTEELARLAAHAGASEVRTALAALLAEPEERAELLTRLLELRARLAAAPEGAAAREELLVAAARALRADGESDLFLRLVAGFRLRALAPETLALAREPRAGSARRRAALRALLEIGAPDAQLCLDLARAALPGEEFQRLALDGLLACRTAEAPALVLELCSSLPPALRRHALEALLARAAAAEALLAALAEGQLEPQELVTLPGWRRLGEGAPADPRFEALVAAGAALERQRSVPVLVLAPGAQAYADTNLALRGAFTVEAWVKLPEPITNADGVLGAAGSASLNFHDRRWRFYAGPELGDVLVARRALEPDTWTHVALTRDEGGALALYVNGELDGAGGSCRRDFADLDIGWALPTEGTVGELAEFRLWRGARSAAQLGAGFRRQIRAEERPAELLYAFPSGSAAPLVGAAEVRAFGAQGPPMLRAEEVRALEARFERVRALAQAGGDAAAGRVVFERTCFSCHRLAGSGGEIGPPLDGAALRGLENLLRAVLTPSAAVEGGYRSLRIETRAGERLDGFLASADEEHLVLRRQGREDLRLARSELVRAEFERISVMPEGLLDPLREDEVRDLFAYLQGLR